MTQNSDMNRRIEALEKIVDGHIHDGIDVWKGLEGLKIDVMWIKRALWGLVGIGITVCAFLVKFLLLRLPPQP